ncbi:MAG: AraC family transcriptional regulator [Spirochaetaceae bacterium]|nr:MAG: AraC family transcriptional regulator [Spirochaetaceae bacterium]
MVHYLGSGIRNYSKRPLMPYARSYWEFQAILSGSASPLFLDETLSTASPRLWVFPPGLVHGWHSAREAPCEVAVFHVDSVPGLMQHVCRNEGYVHVALDDRECVAIRAACATLIDALESRDRLVALEVDEVIARLCRMVLRGNLDLIPEHNEQDSTAARVVEQGFAFYAEHMNEGIGGADIAAHCGYSVAHFRRLVERVRGESPRAVMGAMRMERARHLLSMSSIPVSRIAEACGYAEIASFSRAFATVHGTPPLSWRERWPDVRQKSSISPRPVS